MSNKKGASDAEGLGCLIGLIIIGAIIGGTYNVGKEQIQDKTNLLNVTYKLSDYNDVGVKERYCIYTASDTTYSLPWLQSNPCPISLEVHPETGEIKDFK